MLNWIVFTLIIILTFTLIVKNKIYSKLWHFTHLFRGRFKDDSRDTNFDFELISRYFNNVVKTRSFYYVISDRVALDLDIDELFRFIDYTTSKIGQQFLYMKLRTIGTRKDLNEFDKLVGIFEENPKLAERSTRVLSKLRHQNSYFFEELIHSSHVSRPRRIKYIYLLNAMFGISALLSFFITPFLLVLIPIYIINLFFHYQNKTLVNNYLIGVSELYKSVDVAKRLSKEELIKGHFRDFTFSEKVLKIQRKTRFIRFEKQMSNDIFSGIWSILELIKIAFNIEIILFYNFIDEILAEKESINKLFDFIGNVDSAISVAALRKVNESHVSKPEFSEDKSIKINNIIHPLIDECIPNSLDLKDSSLLLSGSNMSGKTTFIRTVSVNSILAQTLMICFAESYKAPFFKLYSSVRISDNLLAKTSYYLEEVLTIKEFIDASQKDETCLFVLDEILTQLENSYFQQSENQT